MAKVSVARRNLKEAAGKPLARRTGSGYEASMRDEKAKFFKVQYLYGTHGRRSDGHKRERKSALPGEVCRPASELAVEGFRKKVRELVRKGRGGNLGFWIKQKLPPIIRGWGSYFRLAEVRQIFEEPDCWLRRKARVIIWRQLKKPRTRMKALMKSGLDETRAWKSAYNGRGPWWNAGASHINEAFPKRFFDDLGFVSLLDLIRRFQCQS